MKWYANNYYRKKLREETKSYHNAYKSMMATLNGYWHPVFAWWPRLIKETTHDNIVVPAHYVWLEWVDTRFSGVWQYRSNTIEPGYYEVKIHKWDDTHNSPIDRIEYMTLADYIGKDPKLLNVPRKPPMPSRR